MSTSVSLVLLRVDLNDSFSVRTLIAVEILAVYQMSFEIVGNCQMSVKI